MTVRKTMALLLSVLVACLTLAVHVSAATPGSVLSPTYYDNLCRPPFGTMIFRVETEKIVTPLLMADRTLIAALLRHIFHDGFVQGADGSSLIATDPAYPPPERTSFGNTDSLRGFEVVDAVKVKLESICPGVYSCADILQECARVAMKSSALNGNFMYDIQLGRRDGRTSLASEANGALPPPTLNYTGLVTNFATKFFSPIEMLLLSGAHTIGRAHCRAFKARLYDFAGVGTGTTDPDLNPAYAAMLKGLCPQNGTGNEIVPMNFDSPFSAFDNMYFQNVIDGKVLFKSDSALKMGDPANVSLYAGDNLRFKNDFKKVLVKLSELDVKLYPAGEIRSNCSKRN